MTRFKIYKLRFTSPLHLGDERADYDKSLSVYHSDSMYAAITAALAKTGHSIPDTGDLGFIVSSLFPYFQKEGKSVYFLPKVKKTDDFDTDIRKKVKKIEWLDVNFFNKYINGKSLFTADELDEDVLQDKYMSGTKIDDKFILKEVNPRVTVSRDFSKDANPFYMERLYFKYESGLYFIVTGEKFETIEKALNILKDEGIGTDRTIGNGFFEWESAEINLNLPSSEYGTNLSMFIPESKKQLTEMLEDKNAAYSFQKRGGWITDEGLNTFRKNNIYMLNEGSVFKTKISDYSIKGKIVDLKPNLNYESLGRKEHSVWRNGKAIFIPIKI
jgi:CRISPR type III-A-associated RAMP protein Csm4